MKVSIKVLEHIIDTKEEVMIPEALSPHKDSKPNDM
jgi:hypothetical protein